MAYTTNPRYGKKGFESNSEPSAGNKRVNMQYLDPVSGDVATIGKAPRSRVYTRDYSKTTEPYAPNNQDYVTAALGKNPFRV